MTSIERIDSAKDLSQAASLAGEEYGNGYTGQMAYIQAKRGARATSGYFQPTERNIRAKFAKVWAEENPGKPGWAPVPDHASEAIREEIHKNLRKAAGLV